MLQPSLNVPQMCNCPLSYGWKGFISTARMQRVALTTLSIMSIGITATVCVCVYFIFLRWESCSVAHAEVQWHDLSLLQPPSPRFKQFSASASQVAGIISTCHNAQRIFVFFSRDGVSPRWPGWSQSLDLVIHHPPWPPKVLELQV